MGAGTQINWTVTSVFGQKKRLSCGRNPEMYLVEDAFIQLEMSCRRRPNIFKFLLRIGLICGKNPEKDKVGDLTLRNNYIITKAILNKHSKTHECKKLYHIFQVLYISLCSSFEQWMFLCR